MNKILVGKVFNPSLGFILLIKKETGFGQKHQSFYSSRLSPFVNYKAKFVYKINN